MAEEKQAEEKQAEEKTAQPIAETSPLKAFEHTDLGLKYSLEADPSVYDVICYDSTIAENRGFVPAYITLWEAAKLVIKDWQCEAMPNKDVDLKRVRGESLHLTQKIIKRVGLEVQKFRLSLEETPKN